MPCLRVPLPIRSLSQLSYRTRATLSTSSPHQSHYPQFSQSPAQRALQLPHITPITRHLATMSQSHACCTVPPVVADDYKGKGEYTTIDGLKTYITGPKDAKTAILFVYDIFGFFPQTIQGADILAYGDKERQYQVIMPDWFEGSPADISWYPPDTKEKGEKLGAFFGSQGAPGKTVSRIPKILSEVKAQHSTIQEWGILGLCWGGKVVNLISQAGTPFKAAAAAHPAMIDANDAAGVTIPYALLPSKDESKEDVEKWTQAIKVKHLVQWWPNQVHGFLGARGDLKDPAVKADYEKGYGLLLNWFHENL